MKIYFFHNIYTKLTIHVSSNSNKNKRKKEETILMITQHPIFLTIRHNKIITHGKLKTRLFQYISYHLTINHKISTHYDTIK